MDRMSAVTTIIVAIITGGLGVYGGYYQSQSSYKTEELKQKTKLELNTINYEQEIKKEKIKVFTTRCDRLNSLNRELISLYQVDLFEKESSRSFEALTKAEKIKFYALSVKPYLEEESENLFWSSLKVASQAGKPPEEATFIATLESLNVELKKCNGLNSFPVL